MLMSRAVETWTMISTALAGLMFAWTMLKQYFPPHLRGQIETYVQRLVGYAYPYIQIKFPEFSGERLKRSEAYTAIQNYLMANAVARAKRLKADAIKDSQSLVLTMDENEEITDTFEGVKVRWSSSVHVSRNNFSFYPKSDERRYFRLTVHRNHRGLITERYIKHILNEGKVIVTSNRQRKLYMNNSSSDWYGYKSMKWSHVVFEHPATFETLAMDPAKKEIMDDLTKFTKGKEYYARIGKAWKRGYLLYGPPGTGKSSMIAAMANFLKYDVYDLELTTVKNNSELRKLLIETSSKSIIVIEDIDCSLDLTGQRKKEEKKDDDENDDPAKKMAKHEENKPSKVTLSGLLNFIDGIWSACSGERIIVFTTNHMEKLDPALIRRGRMDKHIEMSYCSFEAFKLLARNYLDIEDAQLFPKVRDLLAVAEMTPADVAENLLSKSTDDDVDTCLKNLIAMLESKVKEDGEARAKAAAAAAAEGVGNERKDDEGGEKSADAVANGAKENGF